MPKDNALLGKMFEVIITTTGKHYLKGDVLAESLTCAPSRPTPLPRGTVSGATEWRQRTTTVAAERTTTSTDSGSSKLHEPLSSGSRSSINGGRWLSLGDVALILVAALVLCAALILTHTTHLFTIWSR